MGTAEEFLRSAVEVTARPNAFFVSEAFVSMVGVEADLLYFVTSGYKYSLYIVTIINHSCCKLSVGELELVAELESLSAALTEFDVVEPVPDDGDITEISRQLELCVVRDGILLSV